MFGSLLVSNAILVTGKKKGERNWFWYFRRVRGERQKTGEEEWGGNNQLPVRRTALSRVRCLVVPMSSHDKP